MRPHVLITFTPTEAEHLSIVKANRAEGKRNKKTYNPLLVAPANLAAAAPNGTSLHSISLPSPLKPAESTTLEVFYVLTHSLEPFPAEIMQTESQLVYYRDSAVVLLSYHIQIPVFYIKETQQLGRVLHEGRPHQPLGPHGAVQRIWRPASPMPTRQ